MEFSKIWNKITNSRSQENKQVITIYFKFEYNIFAIYLLICSTMIIFALSEQQ